jgi:pyruvate formate lyase activating enzyme
MPKKRRLNILSGKSVPIKGFIEVSFVDWVGKIASVIFLPYCNFKCPYCQNPELVLNPDSLESIDIDDILKRLSNYKGWIDGICITGGEPTIHESLPELICYIKQNSGLAVKLDTNGANPKMLEGLIKEKLLDAVSMDVKAPLDDIAYCKAAGVVVDIEKIKKSIDILKDSDLDIEFRTTIHPKMFTKKDIRNLASQLKGVKRYKLQNFNANTDTIDPALKGSVPFDEETFKALQELARKIIQG